MNAADSRGVTPLHLALSKLRMLGEREEGRGGGGEGVSTTNDRVSTFRKKEIMHVSLI